MLFRRVCLSFVVLVLSGCNAKRSFDNRALAAELDSIFKIDQKYRTDWMPTREKYGWDSPEMDALRERQTRVDESNVRRIREIVNMVGTYPGRSIVGDSASGAAFFVLQHAPDSVQKMYFALIIDAAKNDELDKGLAAQYHDRYLMHLGRPQIYGSQVRVESRIDSLTGTSIDSLYVWPIADTTGIDSLRKANGMMPLEEYLNEFGLSRWTQRKAAVPYDR